jgi:hypothetical protein
MGWNQGFTIFENTVIGAYNLGKLDIDLLDVLMEPYRDTDIDSGGKEGFLTNDGKFIEQLVIEVHGGSLPPKPDDDDDMAMDKWWEDVGCAFGDITRNKYGWR